MRGLTIQQRDACAMQAKLFEASTEASEDSSAAFIRRFMNSNVAKRLDDNGYARESSTIEQTIHEVDAEYGSTPYGSKKYSRSEMHWMGYIYRYMCFAAEMTSKKAYRLIGARELRALYQPYHSLDPEQAVERVLEAHGFGSDAREDPISHGVAILKRIRQNDPRKI